MYIHDACMYVKNRDENGGGGGGLPSSHRREAAETWCGWGKKPSLNQPKRWFWRCCWCPDFGGVSSLKWWSKCREPPAVFAPPWWTPTPPPVWFLILHRKPPPHFGWSSLLILKKQEDCSVSMLQRWEKDWGERKRKREREFNVYWKQEKKQSAELAKSTRGRERERGGEVWERFEVV